MDDSRLKLNRTVTEIGYTYHPDPHSVTVTTANGEVYKARYAIITFPLGVFQHGLVQYSPPLPSWKTDVLNNLGFAYYLNIHVKFPDGTQPFWDENLNIMHAHERKGYYVHFLNMGKVAPGNALLIVSIIDKEAIVVARQPKLKTIEQINQVLKNLYGDKAVAVQDIYIPDFINNPRFFGCFSSITHGLTNRTFHVVPAPIGPLFFAGEHTVYNDLGFVHGAYLSGISVVKEVIECHESLYCPSTFYIPNKRPGFYYKRRK
jgi:polyamine oxidase